MLQWLLALSVLLTSCVTTQTTNPVSTGHGATVNWFTGSVDQAFAAGKKSGTPVFLYWGAQWCPPCNEIKAQVFSTRKFAELMQLVIPVYLDGDSEKAQIWGEKLAISGYPTLLVLDADGRELIRLSESVNVDEFATALTSALANRRGLLASLELAAQGKAEIQDWRLLAYFSWYDAKDTDLLSEKILTWRQAAADKIPAEYIPERALLAARLLDACVGLPEGKVSPVCEKVRKAAKNYITAMFVDAAAMTAARATIVYSAKSVLTWSYAATDAKDLELMKKKWLVAASRLQTNQELSTDIRLWALNPEIEFWQMGAAKGALAPPDLQERVATAAAAADAEAKSEYERQAVISGAAYLLGQVNRVQEARQLLQAEIKRTKSPWYYYSALSRLEESFGAKEAALKWSGMARQTAQGSATRLQWIASDISLNAKLSGKARVRQLALLTDEFYRTAFSLADGFAGRNLRAADKVGKDLASLAQVPPLKKVVKDYAGRCAELKREGRERCQEHFRALAKG